MGKEDSHTVGYSEIKLELETSTSSSKRKAKILLFTAGLATAVVLVVSVLFLYFAKEQHPFTVGPVPDDVSTPQRRNRPLPHIYLHSPACAECFDSLPDECRLARISFADFGKENIHIDGASERYKRWQYNGNMG